MILKLPHRKMDGFTLLEVMVALAILAIVSAGLITALNRSVFQAKTLEKKTFAMWIAENRLSEMRSARLWPDPAATTSAVTMAGKKWNVVTAIEPALRSDMRNVEITVTSQGDDAPAAVLTGFLGKN